MQYSCRIASRARERQRAHFVFVVQRFCHPIFSAFSLCSTSASFLDFPISGRHTRFYIHFGQTLIFPSSYLRHVLLHHIQIPPLWFCPFSFSWQLHHIAIVVLMMVFSCLFMPKNSVFFCFSSSFSFPARTSISPTLSLISLYSHLW